MKELTEKQAIQKAETLRNMMESKGWEIRKRIFFYTMHKKFIYKRK